jgi:hypothetical protein
MRSLFTERHIWTSHPYVAFTMVDKLFNPLTLLVGPCLVSYLMYKSTIPVTEGGYHLPWWNILLSYFVWISATRTAKLLPHLWDRPQDIIYVPAFIAFGYYFAIMKLYALCTLHETGWGTRSGIGDASAATAAAEAEARNNEKLRHYQRPLSPFRDTSPAPDSHFQTSATPHYNSGTRAEQQAGRGQMRRRGDYDDSSDIVDMRTGYAR